MEVDIDVGSSSVAATVVNLVQGATKSLVVDMGIVLEGHTSEELPESLLGTVSNRLDTLFLMTLQGKPVRETCTCLHRSPRNKVLCVSFVWRHSKPVDQ